MELGVHVQDGKFGFEDKGICWGVRAVSASIE